VFQKVVQSARLISLPDIYVKLKALIEDPQYTMAEVALLVGSDPGMTTRFLRIVNSPLNRRIRKIETVSMAVGLLGIRQVHDIVLSACVAEAFEGMTTKIMSMKKFWQQSYYCALMAQNLAQQCEIHDSDRLFVTGLLHDIGHLFMYQSIPEESQRAILKAKNLKKPLFLVERDLLGFDYAMVGGYMMKHWDLPILLQATTLFHPEPVKATQFGLEAALVHISSLLVQSDLENGGFGKEAYSIDPSVWATTGLTEEQCVDVRETSAKQFNEEEVSKFRYRSNQKSFFPVFSHISYLPNLASQNAEIYEKSIASFLIELERCSILGVPYFIIHGGSHRGSTKAKGVETYIQSILKGIDSTQGKVTILIENSSGGKNSITGNFQDIQYILEEVNDKNLVQVCFDTCHAFNAGYDLYNRSSVYKTLEELESTIGIENVAVVHANDSKSELGSNRDIHEHIGLGMIGEIGFKELVNSTQFSEKPWILETPVDEIRGDSDNLTYLRMLRNKE